MKHRRVLNKLSFDFRYDLGTMALNNVGKLRNHHQFIGIFSIKKGIFNHKSTNQPKSPEESESSRFCLIFKVCEVLKFLKLIN